MVLLTSTEFREDKFSRAFIILNKTGRNINCHNVPDSFHYFAMSHIVCLKLTKYLKIVEKPGKKPPFATVQYELSDIVKYRTGT